MSTRPIFDPSKVDQYLFGCFDALCASQKNFNHVETISC